MIAITHLPSPHMNRALRTFVDFEPIDLELAWRQHDEYCRTLEQCGAAVRRLNVNSEHPDCVFIEDSAIVLDELAVLCSMGHANRRPEPAGIEPVLREYREMRRVELPATIDGGDVLRVDRTLLVGLSERTNAQAAAALEIHRGPVWLPSSTGGRSRLPASQECGHGLARRPVARQSSVARHASARSVRVRAIADGRA